MREDDRRPRGRSPTTNARRWSAGCAVRRPRRLSRSGPALCWRALAATITAHDLGPGGRRFRRMVFSMREISALLDHYAPPVNQVLDDAAASPRPRRAREEKPADASR